MTRFLRRLVSLFRHRHAEGELAREMSAHLALLEDEYRSRGMTTDEARLAARRAMGSVALAKDLHRDARSFAWVEDLRQDLRHGLRALRRTPGFTFVAVLTLALGIGANTAIFSVVNTVLLRPVSYSHPDRLVRLFVNLPASATASRTPMRVQSYVTAVELAEIRSRSTALAGIGAMGFDLVAISDRADAARLPVMRATSAVFGMIDARPAIGRTIDVRDDQPEAEPVALLSHRTWQREFGGNAAIVGHTVSLENTLGPRQRSLHRVVGIMPPDFEFPDTETRVWTSLRDLSTERQVQRPILARLKDGVSLGAASTEINGILRDLRRDARGWAETTFDLVPHRDNLITEVRPALLVLTGAVGLVLLIACINVTNLLLARSAGRQRELAIRGALGAGRGRLIRQSLTESVLLSLIGAACGVLLALGGVELLQQLAAGLARADVRVGATIPRLDEIGIDRRVLEFTLATSIVAGVLLGLLPAWRYSRPPAAALASSDRTTAHGQKIGSAFVVAEISLAMVLLLGAGLLLRGFIKLAAVEPGFTSQGVVTFQVALPLDRYREPERQRAFAERVVEWLNAQPGVERAAYARQLPLIGLRDTIQIRRSADPVDARGSDVRYVSHDFLEVMGIAVVRGTGFGPVAGQRELLINRALATRDFAGENPIGQPLYVGRDAAPWRIVGVVENVRQFGLDRQAEPQFFVDAREWRKGMPPLFPVGAYYAVRSTGDADGIVSMIRTRVRELDPGATLFNVAPMEALVAETISRPRMYAVLVGLFALVGMALAVTGIYGVMAYAVTRRTCEIGVRVALGAPRRSVMALVLRQAMRVTAAGLLIGLAGAAMLSRYLEGMLFGVTPLDAVTFVIVTILFAIVATTAAIVPTRRALSVNPLHALRAE
jgi:predicted permease